MCVLQDVVDIATVVSVILLYIRTTITLRQYEKSSMKQMIDQEILQFVASDEFEKALDKSVISKKIDNINDKLNQLIIAICLTDDKLKNSIICKGKRRALAYYYALDYRYSTR